MAQTLSTSRGIEFAISLINQSRNHFSSICVDRLCTCQDIYLANRTWQRWIIFGNRLSAVYSWNSRLSSIFFCLVILFWLSGYLRFPIAMPSLQVNQRSPERRGQKVATLLGSCEFLKFVHQTLQVLFLKWFFLANLAIFIHCIQLHFHFNYCIAVDWVPRQTFYHWAPSFPSIAISHKTETRIEFRRVVPLNSNPLLLKIFISTWCYSLAETSAIPLATDARNFFQINSAIDTPSASVSQVTTVDLIFIWLVVSKKSLKFGRGVHARLSRERERGTGSNG